MDHFWAIRSRKRSRRLLKRLARPVLSWIHKQGKERLEQHPRLDRLRPYLEENTEVVIDARRFFRVIDFNRREVTNIFKDDDLPFFFDNEVGARRRLSGADFIPRLIGVDEAAKVFTEEYTCGRPFKSGSLRELDAGDFAGRLKIIIRRIQNSAPVRSVKAEDYVAGLIEEILSASEAAGEDRRYIRALGQKASGLGRVELVFSHGDFRADQLFFSPDGSIKIIDWENSGYFSRYRDLTGFFINEERLYANPEVSLEKLLDEEVDRMEAVCSLYLLELASVPVRIGRPSLLPGSLSAIRAVERRLNKAVSGNER